MQRSYLFYDLETTGLDKAFDQVLQFAAIRTDLDLKELERYQFYVKISPDVVPSPWAMITHRIPILDIPPPLAGGGGLKDRRGGTLSELEAIQKIHQLINTPGTISCGYNTLGFDDEFLRFSFYRHLLPPYTHQYANNCSRMDIYPITVMYYLYNNSIIKWPYNQGKPSLKLADINTLNQFFEGSSHDAMVDVEVTLALARCFIQSRKKWDYLIQYFNKNKDKERFEKFSDNQALLIDGKLGADCAYQWPVLYLGQHSIYKNQYLFLRLDNKNLNLNTKDNITENTWVFRKKCGESGLLLPLKERYTEKLAPGRLDLAKKNSNWLKNNPEIVELIKLHYKNYVYPVINNLDIDAALYSSNFLSYEEENLCQQFHYSHPSEKSNLIKLFKKENLRHRSIRLMGRYYPEYLSEDNYQVFSDYMARIWKPESDSIQNPIINYKGQSRLSAYACLKEINTMRAQEDIALDTEQKNLLNQLEHYILDNKTSHP